MKKIILLPVFLIALFTSCSNDDTAALTNEEDTAAVFAERAVGGCFESLSGFVEIDVTNGIGNPVLGFVADTDGASATVAYTVSVEIQALTECEDLNSGYGRSFTKKIAVTNPDVNMPLIQVTTAELPSTCYRWRIIVSSTALKCGNATEWYDAPLL